MKEMRCLHCYSNEFSERNGHLYCLYCGSKYRQRPEDQEILLSMAYRELRFMNFLDAENAFEDIIDRHPDLPEAYWGCVCARYGIKFEQDYTGKQIPTCCLPTIESILEDSYYQKALELSDEETAAWYGKQGEYLERVRKTWIERARKLAPYDVFISYKDSDQEKGLDRTEDSRTAQDIYTHLVTQGHSVFYSRESLSNVIGEKYEPYIFQALTTARAMIVYGSTPEYINSTWVRNEWQRYAKKIQKGEKAEGSLIVICDGFSPKELPPMLRSVQVLDGKDKFCYSKLDDRLKLLLSKKASSEQVARKKAEEAKKRAEAEAKRKAEEDARKKAEKAKRRAEAEARRKAEEEAQRKAEEEARQKAAEKAQARKKRRKRSVITVTTLILLAFIAIPVLLFTFADRANEPNHRTDKSDDRVDESDDRVDESDDRVDESDSIADEIRTSQGLEYTSNHNGTCYVSGIGSCKDTAVVIPQKSPKGDKVTSIGASAFRYCSNLTSVTIPNSVTSIGTYAFSGCTSLTSITIPDSLTSIGNDAFYGCSSLTSIEIPDSVTSIGDYAFKGCTGLTSIEIPNSVKSIGHYAIKGCTGLTSITIPNSVTSIGEMALSDCSSLTSIIVDEDNSVYHSAGNCLIETASKTLIVGCQNSIIPSDGSVTSIGDYAFMRCNGWTSITIPNCVKNLGNYAFYECSSLTSITIPTGMTSIGDSAFYDCRALTSITFKGTMKQWRAISKGISWKGGVSSTAKIICSNGTMSLDGTVLEDPETGTSFSVDLKFTSKGNNTCSVSGIGTCKDTAVVIPKVSPDGDTVTGIGASAFYKCGSLTSVTIPDSVTSIGDYAFRYCSNLTSVTIPNSVTSIGYSTFDGCSSLTSITIPDSVTSIGGAMCNGCSSLTSVTIPNSVTSIGNSAFRGCSSLTSVEIPDSVTSMGIYAFYNCSTLTSITFKGTVAQWNAISKGADWKKGVPSTAEIVCSDGTISISES